MQLGTCCVACHGLPTIALLLVDIFRSEGFWRRGPVIFLFCAVPVSCQLIFRCYRSQLHGATLLEQYRRLRRRGKFGGGHRQKREEEGPVFEIPARLVGCYLLALSFATVNKKPFAELWTPGAYQSSQLSMSRALPTVKSADVVFPTIALACPISPLYLLKTPSTLVVVVLCSEHRYRHLPLLYCVLRPPPSRPVHLDSHRCRCIVVGAVSLSVARLSTSKASNLLQPRGPSGRMHNVKPPSPSCGYQR